MEELVNCFGRELKKNKKNIEVNIFYKKINIKGFCVIEENGNNCEWIEDVIQNKISLDNEDVFDVELKEKGIYWDENGNINDIVDLPVLEIKANNPNSVMNYFNLILNNISTSKKELEKIAIKNVTCYKIDHKGEIKELSIRPYEINSYKYEAACLTKEEAVMNEFPFIDNIEGNIVYGKEKNIGKIIGKNGTIIKKISMLLGRKMSAKAC
jgi:hypothetical protein